MFSPILWCGIGAVFITLFYLLYAHYFCDIRKRKLHKLKSQAVMVIFSTIFGICNYTIGFFAKGIDSVSKEYWRGKAFGDQLWWLADAFGVYTPYIILMVLFVAGLYAGLKIFFTNNKSHIFRNEL